jgi:hypothetical protein
MHRLERAPEERDYCVVTSRDAVANPILQEKAHEMCALIDVEFNQAAEKLASGRPDIVTTGPMNSADNQDAGALPVAHHDPCTPQGPGVRS